MKCNCNKNSEIGNSMEEHISEVEAKNSVMELENAHVEASEEDTNLRHKNRSEKEKKALLTRLSKIEGQVRGVKNMLEEERYCVDILTQVLAIQSAMNGFSKELLSRHVKSCVMEDIKNGKEDAVDELCELLKKMMK